MDYLVSIYQTDFRLVEPDYELSEPRRRALAEYLEKEIMARVMASLTYGAPAPKPSILEAPKHGLWGIVNRDQLT